MASQRSEATAQCDTLTAQCDQLSAQRDQLTAQRDQLTAQRDEAAAQRDQLTAQRDQLIAQRDEAAAQRDEALLRARQSAAAEHSRPVSSSRRAQLAPAALSAGPTAEEPYEPGPYDRVAAAGDLDEGELLAAHSAPHCTSSYPHPNATSYSASHSRARGHAEGRGLGDTILDAPPPSPERSALLPPSPGVPSSRGSARITSAGSSRPGSSRPASGLSSRPQSGIRDAQGVSSFMMGGCAGTGSGTEPHEVGVWRNPASSNPGFVPRLALSPSPSTLALALTLTLILPGQLAGWPRRLRGGRQA